MTDAFIGPLRSKQQYEARDLSNAWHDFAWTVAQAVRLPEIVDWLARRLP